MRKKYSVLCLMILMMGWSAPVAYPQTAQQSTTSEVLTAAGSGVNLGITRVLATAFMKDHTGITMEIPGSIGTGGAIKAAADGVVTFGLISRALKEEEKAKMPDVTVQRYARVPVVIGAHPSVVDDGITSQELVDIYRGTKTRWKDGNEIIVQSREPFDSGIQLIQKEIPGFKEAYTESLEAKRWFVTFTDQDANLALSRTPYAIGITDLGMIKSEELNIKVLELNGIIPGPESLAGGQYPLGRDLFFLYRKEALSQGARDFLDFVNSSEGSEILKTHGYIPVNRE